MCKGEKCVFIWERFVDVCIILNSVLLLLLKVLGVLPGVLWIHQHLTDGALHIAW